MTTLNIIETAYRATLEEQDDTVVWFVNAMRNAGADVAVLLRGGAIGCALRGQDPTPLAFGDLKQKNRPDLAGDLARVIAGGVAVYYLADDLGPRGLDAKQLIEGVQPVALRELPALLERHDRVWHW